MRRVTHGARVAAPFVVSLAVVVLLVRAAPRPTWAGVHAPWLGVGLVAFVLANAVICPLRWWLFLPSSWSKKAAIGRYLEGAFVGLFVPLGSDVVRTVGTRDAAAATVTDRTFGGAVLLVAAGIAVALGGPFRPMAGVSPGLAGLLVVVAGVAVGAVVVIVARRRSSGLSVPRFVLAGASSVAYLAVVAVAIMAAGRAAGVAVPLTTALVGTPILLLGAALPNVFGLSLGLPALAWICRSSEAAPGAPALLAGLLVALVWVSALPGGALLARRHLHGPRGRMFARRSIRRGLA